MWLVLAFLGMAILFLGMDAGFIGVIQILVYAGAILVLFLFVIMLLNLSPTGLARMDRPRFKLLGLAASAAFVGTIVAVTVVSVAWTKHGTEEAVLERTGTGDKMLSGNVLEVADKLFTDHLLPFEVASVLLLVAIVGAVALTKRKL